MADVTLAEQLACARRELRLRETTYPTLVMRDRLLPRTATRELEAMQAIVQTLERLVRAEARGGQGELWAEED
jgi:hypothetical protein